MSRHYLVLANIEDKLMFHSLRTNAGLAAAARTGHRMLCVRHPHQRIKILLVRPLPWNVCRKLTARK